MTQPEKTFKVITLSALALFMGMASQAYAETTGRYIDDATITAKVKEAIFADSQLKVLQVTVDTSHGIVQLSGVVDAQTQESEALYVASHVDGVLAVTDKLSVKSVQAD